MYTALRIALLTTTTLMAAQLHAAGAVTDEHDAPPHAGAGRSESASALRTEKPSLIALSKDLKRHIGSYLPPEDQRNLSQTCKSLTGTATTLAMTPKEFISFMSHFSDEHALSRISHINSLAIHMEDTTTPDFWAALSRLKNSLTTLTIKNLPERKVDITPLWDIPWKNLIELCLFGYKSGSGVAAIATSPHMAKLQTLNLNYNFINDDDVATIANSPYMVNLHTLDLCDNKIGAAGAAAIANSPYMANLQALYLAANSIGAVGTAAIVTSPHMVKLHTLYLWGNSIGSAGAIAIATSTHLVSLQSLHLGCNEIGDAGAARIAISPHMAKLHTLNLYRSSIGDAGAAAIAYSPHMASLQRLDLRDNSIGDATKDALRAVAATKKYKLEL